MCVIETLVEREIKRSVKTKKKKNKKRTRISGKQPSFYIYIFGQRKDANTIGLYQACVTTNMLVSGVGGSTMSIPGCGAWSL